MLIKWFISSVLFSVLANGASFGFFQSSRGLNQGYHHSPYLFVLAMEVLRSILQDGRGVFHLGVQDESDR